MDSPPPPPLVYEFALLLPKTSPNEYYQSVPSLLFVPIWFCHCLIFCLYYTVTCRLECFPVAKKVAFLYVNFIALRTLFSSLLLCVFAVSAFPELDNREQLGRENGMQRNCYIFTCRQVCFAVGKNKLDFSGWTLLLGTLSSALCANLFSPFLHFLTWVTRNKA